MLLIEDQVLPFYYVLNQLSEPMIMLSISVFFVLFVELLFFVKLFLLFSLISFAGCQLFFALEH
jgi:hypothetical protein